MFLLIDPSAYGELRLSLVASRHKFYSVVYNINSRRSKSILTRVVNFIKREMISLATLDGLGVINGAGSFTGGRLAVLVANPLGWLYDLPVYSFCQTEKIFFPISSRPKERGRSSDHEEEKQRKFYSFIKPIYTNKPNITIQSS